KTGKRTGVPFQLLLERKELGGNQVEAERFRVINDNGITGDPGQFTQQSFPLGYMGEQPVADDHIKMAVVVRQGDDVARSKAEGRMIEVGFYPLYTDLITAQDRNFETILQQRAGDLSVSTAHIQNRSPRVGLQHLQCSFLLHLQ